MEPSPQPLVGPQIYRWHEPPVVGLALIAVAAGFGQFGVVAALADVAAEFGTPGAGADLTLTEQAGLSGTTLGTGLAIIRFASVASLPLAGIADGVGRRRTLTSLAAVGLVVVATASLSPGFWWFVALIALSRPMLTAANAVAGVSAAEQTGTQDRARAIALLAAGFGVGAGLFAIVRGTVGAALGLRGMFALTLGALVVVLVARSWITESDRYRIAAATPDRPLPVLGAVNRRYLGRLLPVLGIAFAIGAVTGPANSFVFLYSEQVLELSAGVTAALVVGAGAFGLAGLLVGRWGADRFGRRITAATGLVGVAAAGLLTYSGPVLAGGVGYLLAVLAGSTFAPAAGAIETELFPTPIRATVAGWTVLFGVLGAVSGLLGFGALVDHFNRFDLASILVFVPASSCALLFALLPETRGTEMEEIAEL